MSVSDPTEKTDKSESDALWFLDDSKKDDKPIMDRSYEELEILNRQLVVIKNKITQIEQQKTKFVQNNNLPDCCIPISFKSFVIGTNYRTLIDKFNYEIILVNDKIIYDVRTHDDLSVQELVDIEIRKEKVKKYLTVAMNKFYCGKINKMDFYVKANYCVNNKYIFYTYCLTFINNNPDNCDDISLYCHATKELTKELYDKCNPSDKNIEFCNKIYKFVKGNLI